MRVTTLLVAAVLMSLGSGASAALVGIYFDEGASCNAGVVQRYTSAPAYLIFTSMPTAEISAWEINLSFQGLALVGFQARNENIMVSPRTGDYMCGLASPQPTVNGAYVAADLSIMPTTPFGPSDVRGSGVYFHFLPADVPCYLDGAGNAHELQFSTWNHILVIVNGIYPCVVGDEVSSFGAVKSLYR